jgi:hypothetical protein
VTEINRPTPIQIRQIADRLLRSGSDTLRQLGIEKVARGIAQAVLILADKHTSIGQELRQELHKQSRLSKAMVEWGLSTTFSKADFDSLLDSSASALYTDEQRIAIPARLVVTVLAGNVFSAGFRAVVLPLLVGSPVLAKVASKDDVLPRFFKAALDRTNPVLGSCFEVIRFRGGDRKRQDALFNGAEVVSLYGGDDTVKAIRKAIPPLTRLLVHGHGLGAIAIPASSISDNKVAVDIAARVALDVAAYDQRGCLSPHVVCVERNSVVNGAEFARLLAHQGMNPIASSLPRGRVPRASLADQMQWRASARVRGRLYEEKTFAVSYEGCEPLRSSPGFRNVGVYDYDDLDSLSDRLFVFATHLKALGVSGTTSDRARVARALRPPLAPRISDVGAMQTPPFEALADGQSDLNQLVRWIAY